LNPVSAVGPKRTSRSDCVTVVTLCDEPTVNLSQNKHPDVVLVLSEKNRSASLAQAAFHCSSPLWDSEGAVCESMKFFRNSVSSVVLFANCASHRCGLHASSLTSRVTIGGPLNARHAQTLR